MRLRSLIFPLIAITFSFSDPCAPSNKGSTELQRKKTEPAVEVEVAYPRFQESNRLVSALGKFTVSDRLAVRAEFNGTLEKIYVNEGDQVNAGDPLCLFKSDELNRQIEAKQAELKEAQATLDLDRKKMGEPSPPAQVPQEGHFLDEENGGTAPSTNLPSAEKSPHVPSPQALDDPGVIIRLDEAKVERITNELSQFDDTLKKLTVLSPSAGLISKKGSAEGGSVLASDLLFEIITFNPISFTVGLPQEVSSYVDKQTPIKVQPVSLPDTTLDGAIYYVSPDIDPSSRTLEVRAHFPNDNGKIKEGDQGKAFVATHKVEKILVAPRRAVVEAPEGSFIYSVQVGKAVKSPATIGQDMGSGEVEIQANIRIDDPVILSNQSALKEGVPVSVVINSPALNPTGGP